MNTKQQTLAVVGLGYVGLPVALLAKEKGWHVIGVDVDEKKVAMIAAGTSPIEDEAVSAALTQYPIEATTDPAAVSSADMVIVAVPTPVTKENQPDLTPLRKALESIGPHLHAGQTVSIESTINPGVMEEIVLPLLKPYIEAGAIVHCPERINPGDVKWTVRTIPRVIGGFSTEGVQRAKELYEQILDAPLQPMATVTEAEAVKIFENTFRDINIAFVNEMARSFDKLGIDVKHVIEGAATKPFAFMAHYPSSGVGGHCISVDPYYMIERARQAGFDHKFLKLAREINDSMPRYTVELMDRGIAELKLKKPTIALLGLAYKKNIDDIRESPALDIRAILEKRGDNVKVFDPHVLALSTVETLEDALAGTDVTILATDHLEFTKTLTPTYLKERDIKIVIDGKNALNAEAIREVGIAYYGIGRSKLT